VSDVGGEVRLDGQRVLVIANEQIGARMAGPAIRSLNLARQLARRGASVTLAMPQATDVDPQLLTGFTVETFGVPSRAGFRRLATGQDVVVTQPQRVDVAWGLRRSGARVVYDLYVPSFVERIAQLGTEPMEPSLKRRLLERDQREYCAAIELGDAFICASERQRDHWLGALGQAGRLDVGLLARDARGDALVGVVPFGAPDAAPEPVTELTHGIRGTLVPTDAIIALWTGGLWNWFDPVSVVEGIAAARRVEPRLHLVMMGVKHPGEHWVEQEASRAMRERAADLGLVADGGVVLCEEWIPYDERHRFLLDADIAVSAHRDTLETRLSFRTRFLDHLWCGVPTLTTAGGELADRMVAVGAARTVAEGDAVAWAEALTSLAADAPARAAMHTAALALADAYRWSTVSEPLARIVAASPAATNSPARARRGSLLRYMSLLVRVRVQAKGVRSLGSAARDAAKR